MKILLNSEALSKTGSVTVAGWAENIRSMGKIKFISMRDFSGYIQVTLVKGKVSDELFDIVDSFTKESVLKITGKMQSSKIAPGGKELIPSAIELISKSEQPVPLNISGKIESDLSSRLDWRFLDLRMPRNSAIFRVQSCILHAFRNHFFKKGFVEIEPPGIISAASEGGAELYEVKYFEKNAYLAQSPQLYKQMCIAAGFNKVFMTSPVWRAEPHETIRHINEARQCDIEVAFINDQEALDYLEEVMKEIFSYVIKNCADDLKTIGRKLKMPSFVRVSYTNALKDLEKNGVKLSWGEDLTPEAERKLCEINGIDNFVFVYDWPLKVRAFYSMPDDKNPEICKSYDALYGGIEMLSGAVRVHDPKLLEKQIRNRGLNVESFKGYIDSFRYGCPPHAGWSFGLERITMKLLGLENIRDATLFPRDRNRLTP